MRVPQENWGNMKKHCWGLRNYFFLTFSDREPKSRKVQRGILRKHSSVQITSCLWWFELDVRIFRRRFNNRSLNMDKFRGWVSLIYISSFLILNVKPGSITTKHEVSLAIQVLEQFLHDNLYVLFVYIHYAQWWVHCYLIAFIWLDSCFMICNYNILFYFKTGTGIPRKPTESGWDGSSGCERLDQVWNTIDHLRVSNNFKSV